MAEPRPYRRHLRNYLLNARVQLRYIIAVVGVSAAVAGGLGAVIYAQSTFASAQLQAALAAPEMSWLDDDLRARIGAGLGRSDLELVLFMVGVGVGVATVLALVLLVMTHKVAGPLFRMEGVFKRLQRGEFRENVLLAHDADGLVAQFAAAEKEQRRDALDLEARRERGLFVHVHFRDHGLALQVPSDFVKREAREWLNAWRAAQSSTGTLT